MDEPSLRVWSPWSRPSCADVVASIRDPSFYCPTYHSCKDDGCSSSAIEQITLLLRL